MTTQLDTREALFEVMAQITAEREAARPLVEELLSREEPPWDEEIPEEWRTAGFVDELTTGAAGMLDNDPPKSLAFAQLALAVATSIPHSSYPGMVLARIMGYAWKEIGNAHALMGIYDRALREHDRAERYLAQTGALTHDQTSIQLVRAGTLLFTGRFDEAYESAEAAGSYFREVGDQRRADMTDLIKAMVYHRSGRQDAARRTYEELARSMEGTDDLDTLGALYNNLGHLYVQLARCEEAVSAFNRARQIFIDLDSRTGIDRAEWGLARVLLISGEFSSALSRLQALRQAFLGRQMASSAGLVALDIVDALIALDRYAQAQALTEQVVREFSLAKLNDRAITALAYLRELLPKSQRAREAIRHVRSYVEELHFYPTQPFLPLPDDEDHY